MKTPSRYWLWRLARLGLLVGVAGVLGWHFVQSQQAYLSPLVKNRLRRLIDQPPLTTPQVTLDANHLIELENQARAEAAAPAFEPDPTLTVYAQTIIDLLATHNYQLEDDKEFDRILNQVIPADQQSYQRIGTMTLVGERTAADVVEVWLDSQTRETLLDKKMRLTGIATASADISGYQTGIVVQLVAEPASRQSAAQNHISTPTVTEVSDQEVITALNTYRTNHQVHPLQYDQRLCDYAQKRVEDLVVYGGLDHHQGFQADFEDGQRPPQLEDYPGAGFAENLASQFCINGTTGEPFVANSGPALIEWCFDSSQKGHREAQLESQYNAVCVRHAQNMYVVIFGE